MTHFYLGIMPNHYNKTKYKMVDAQIIPIIKNCKTYIKDISDMSPKCPAPPYKKGFKTFIKELKKNNKNYKPLSNKEKQPKLKLKQMTF